MLLMYDGFRIRGIVLIILEQVNSFPVRNVENKFHCLKQSPFCLCDFGYAFKTEMDTSMDDSIFCTSGREINI